MSNDSISLNDGVNRNPHADSAEQFFSDVDNLGKVQHSDFNLEISSSDPLVKIWKSSQRPLQLSLDSIEATTESRVKAKFYIPRCMNKGEVLDVMTKSAKILPPTVTYMERVWDRLADGDHAIMSGSAATTAADVISKLIQDRDQILILANGTLSAVILERDLWKQAALDMSEQLQQLVPSERKLRKLVKSARSLIYDMNSEWNATLDELVKLKAQKSADDAKSTQLMAAHVHMYSAAAGIVSQFPSLSDLSAKVRRSLKVDKYEIPIDDITVYIYVSMLTGVPLDAMIDEIFSRLSQSKTHMQILTRVARKLLYNEQPTPLLPAVDRAVSKYLRDCKPKELGEGIQFKDVPPAAVIVSLCLPHLADLVQPLHRPVCVEDVDDAKERAICAQMAVKELLKYTLLAGATVPQRFELPKMPDTTQWAYHANRWATFVYVGDSSSSTVSHKGDAVPAGDANTSNEGCAPVTHN